MQYYSQPSELGLPILKLLIHEPMGECRQTIFLMERKYNWGWNMSNACKYLWRLGVKSPDIEKDLSKAIEYLSWELESPIRALSEDKKSAIEQAIAMCKDLM